MAEWLAYSYKTTNGDFRVTEIVNLILDGGDYHYYLLMKNGYKTIDVLDILSDEMGIDFQKMSYAGLKDEDAITTQYIAIKDYQIDKYYKNDGDKTFSLTYVGSANEPMQIGKLQGNSFRIRLRNLDLDVAEKVCDKEKHSFTIINYFDIQRFGMPGLPKLSHKIGDSLLLGDYDLALSKMLESGNINKSIYVKWKENSKEYFDNIDNRRKNFFLSAYDAFLWNRKIANIIGKYIVNGVSFKKEGIEFLYASKINDLVRNMLDESNILWHRYDEKGDIFEKQSFRQPYLEVIYRASDIMLDDINLEKYMLDVDFVLPAGSYATNVIDQIMNSIESDVKLETYQVNNSHLD